MMVAPRTVDLSCFPGLSLLYDQTQTAMTRRAVARTVMLRSGMVRIVMLTMGMLTMVKATRVRVMIVMMSVTRLKNSMKPSRLLTIETLS
jgi:hypothetical protein